MSMININKIQLKFINLIFFLMSARCYKHKIIHKWILCKKNVNDNIYKYNSVNSYQLKLLKKKNL